MNDDYQPAASNDKHRWLAAFLTHDWPYLVMLLLSLGGVALSSVSPGPMIPYWEAVVPIFGIACFVARGVHPNNQERLKSIRQDVLHWGAVFVAMRMLMMPELSQMLNADATALMLLTVLALGLFAAGNLIGSWRIGLVGVLLAAAVPAIAWMERSVLLVALGVAGAACLFIFIWLRHSGHQSK